MANKIIHKRTATASNIPGAGILDYGELAINYTDKKLFIKDAADNVVEIAQDQAACTSSIIPATDQAIDLGSPTKQWRDVYVGPGSLYVNGQKVLEEAAGTIIVGADVDQNLQMKTTGTGDIELLAAGTGVVQLKGTVSILAGKNLTSSDSNPISCSVGFDMSNEKITNLATPTATADAATKAYVDGILTAGSAATFGNVTMGNLTVNGTTTTVNSTTLNVADLNITVANGAASAAAANGAGLTVDGASATLLYGSAGDDWTFNKTVNAPSFTASTGDISATLGNVTASGGETMIGNEGGANNGLHAEWDATNSRYKHHITYNDGGGNFNIRVGNVHDGGSVCTEASFPFHMEYVQNNGNLNIKTTSAAQAVDDVITWDTVYTFKANGTLTATAFDGEATSAQYADLAEMYAADGDIEPGTVVSFGGTAEVTTCTEDGDRRVAGVVSSDPAYLMNSKAAGVPVALQGRVPCKVTGVVRKGDMMVAAGNGAARAEADPKMGQVIGKALEDSDGDAVIEVVVGRL